MALCILALASSSRFGRYHLSSVDHDTFRTVPVPRFLYIFFHFVDPSSIHSIIYSEPRSILRKQLRHKQLNIGRYTIFYIKIKRYRTFSWYKLEYIRNVSQFSARSLREKLKFVRLQHHVTWNSKHRDNFLAEFPSRKADVEECVGSRVQWPIREFLGHQEKYAIARIVTRVPRMIVRIDSEDTIRNAH